MLAPVLLMRDIQRGAIEAANGHTMDTLPCQDGGRRNALSWIFPSREWGEEFLPRVAWGVGGRGGERRERGRGRGRRCGHGWDHHPRAQRR